MSSKSSKCPKEAKILISSIKLQQRAAGYILACANAQKRGLLQ